MTEATVLPEGQDSFKLNEVCKLAGVQPYMLRFWGTEFPDLEAAKSDTGQRLYTREQVETILEVRRLLFDEGLTVPAARKKITAKTKAKKAPKKTAAKAKKEEAPKPEKQEAAKAEEEEAPKPEKQDAAKVEEVAPSAESEKESKPKKEPAKKRKGKAAEAANDNAAAAPPADAGKSDEEVDKLVSNRVKPLFAALTEVRNEVSAIIAELKEQPQSKS